MEKDVAYSTFHNHTTFCDGKSTAEEMVRAAIDAGCASIGFSGHSYTWFDESYCMSLAGAEAYRAEVARLREAYPAIRILCGVEQDYFSEEPTDDYDFVIGSVHYVRVAADGSTAAEGVFARRPADVAAELAGRGETPVGLPGRDGEVFLDVDNTEEAFLAAVGQYFGGDVYAFCAAFFAQEEDVLRKTGCTFVGHFDLVTKFNEGDRLFDTADPRYREPALAAARSLCDQGALFEINTGAMAKGYRETPYPAPFILDALREAGTSVILSADCHDAAKLQYALSDDLARGCTIIREL